MEYNATIQELENFEDLVEQKLLPILKKYGIVKVIIVFYGFVVRSSSIIKMLNSKETIVSIDLNCNTCINIITFLNVIL